MNIATRLTPIQTAISKAKQGSALAATDITLMAACKSQSAAIIEEAITAGISVFGENRVQEAEEKWPAIRARHPEVALHLIGGLQSNKTGQALALFDIIQTLDRPKLADAIAREADWAKGGEGVRTKHLFIQVNTGKEPQKSGVTPEEADDFIRYCQTLHLPVAGLMCVPPENQPPAPHFALLRAIAVRNGLRELSMGMSDDYDVAVRMGSSCVRIGRALFGER